MRKWLAAACLAALLLLPACGPLQELKVTLFGEPGGDYQCAYERWTRKADVRRDLVSVLEARVTYRSPEFQEAYLRRWAAVYKTGEAELCRLLAEAAEREGRELNFVLVATTGRREWNDFARPDSLWRIYLQNGRGERLPLSEKRHLEERTQVEGFFQMGPWGEAYELSFGLEEGQARSFCRGPLRLVLTSVLGEAEMSWDVRAAGD